MKLTTLFKQFIVIFLIAYSAKAVKIQNNSQEPLQATPARKDYIYWTPTSANVIDTPSWTIPHTVSSYSYPYSPYSYYTPSPIPYGTGYYSSPGSTWSYSWRKDGKKGNPSEVTGKREESPKSPFVDVTKEIKDLKTELFGNPNVDMKFYRENRKAYFDGQWLQRAQKISKVLELEELVSFYKNKNDVEKKDKNGARKVVESIIPIKETSATNEAKIQKVDEARTKVEVKVLQKEEPEIKEKTQRSDTKTGKRKLDEVKTKYIEAKLEVKSKKGEDGEKTQNNEEPKSNAQIQILHEKGKNIRK